jgi:hypothetical protein
MYVKVDDHAFAPLTVSVLRQQSLWLHPTAYGVRTWSMGTRQKALPIIADHIEAGSRSNESTTFLSGVWPQVA